MYFGENILLEFSRKDILDSDFGIPELKKYPMQDEEHVRSAIKFFNYVEPKYEKELADNIIKKIKQYDIKDINYSEKNRFFKYYKP